MPGNRGSRAGRLTRREVLVGVAGTCTFLFEKRAASQAHGYYRGRVVAEWLPGGRNMRLLEPFEYVEPSGRRWPVPSGVVVDGASIPQVFWSVIGGPFEGLYR